MEGVTHSVAVPATSLYEAAALGVAKFLKSEFHQYHIGPATLLTVAVREPETSHEIRYGKVQEWLQGGAKSPKEQALKVRLRATL